MQTKTIALIFVALLSFIATVAIVYLLFSKPDEKKDEMPSQEREKADKQGQESEKVDYFSEDYAISIFKDEQGNVNQEDVDDFREIQKACQNEIVTESIAEQLENRNVNLTEDLKKKIIEQNIRILAFLVGNGTCLAKKDGVYLTKAQLLSENYEFYDNCCVFIQWVFPSNVPSQTVGIENTLINQLFQTIKKLKIRNKIQNAIRKSAEHFDSYFKSRIDSWRRNEGSHLNKRIVRMITSLKLFNINNDYIGQLCEFYLGIFHETVNEGETSERIRYLQEGIHNAVPLLE